MPEIENETQDPKETPKSNAEVQTPKPEARKAPPPAKEEAKKEEPKVHALGEDDELPDTDELLQLSKSALSKRLARHSKSSLKSIFGTDDTDKIKADLEELNTLRTDKENQRKAQLTEKQRLEEEKAAEKKRADEAEAKLQKEVDRTTFAAYDADATSALEKYVDPEAYELAMTKLKDHVKSLDDDELENTKKVFDKFIAGWVKEHPKYAKPSDEEKPEVKKIPLTTGGGGAKRPTASVTNITNKTPKPGQPNSMNHKEYLEWKKANGHRF